TEIRDFRIRGNYINQHSLLSRKDPHSSKEENVGPSGPGYSPPVVEVELHGGSTSRIVVSELDIPFLCDDDIEKAKGYLSLILKARRGDPQAVKDLALAAQERSIRELVPPQPTESSFVVPSTSCQPHSEQDISQKGFILLKLSQLGYPVPDFVVLTSCAYADRAQRLEEHVSEAIRQLEILTMQGLGDCESPLAFAIRCATAHYIPGVMDTYLNVGVTESTLPRLEKMYGAVAAHKMFLNNLRNLCHSLHREEYAAIVGAVKSDLAPAEVVRLMEQLSEIIRKTDRRLIEDPLSQATFFAREAYKHFEENKDLVLTLCRGAEHYPSLIMQKMICTVRHENAYAGVISSRHTQTGVGVELQTAHDIFGEEMMTGTAEIRSTSFEDREAILSDFPAVYHFVPHL
ncbi:MAG TPA: hypothetical protein VFV92_03060, partial [Candidatus Bathyarchaeia archaeon]|nr:hypothetical protein [Candidatus Bathyarchaeia archaeon]